MHIKVSTIPALGVLIKLRPLGAILEQTGPHLVYYPSVCKVMDIKMKGNIQNFQFKVGLSQ